MTITEHGRRRPLTEGLLKMMPQASHQGKSKIWDQLEGLWAKVVTAAHEVERKLFRGVLQSVISCWGVFSVSSARGMWVPR